MASQTQRLQGRRSVLVLAGLALLTAAVAACAPRTGPRPLPSPEPEPQREPVGEPSRLPPDETRNRVAVLVPLSGPNGPLGRSILNAANLALFDTGGERIRITAYDTSASAPAALNEALADGSGLILGPLLAENVREISAAARRVSIPVIAFSNDVSVAGDGIFVMGFNPGQSVERVVSFARSRGATRFGALVPVGAYGDRAGRALVAAAEGSGDRLVGVEPYNGTAQGARAAAARLAERGQADAVLIADGAATASQAASIVRQVSPQPHLLGTELWATQSGLAALPGLRGAWFAAPPDGNFAAFRSRYRARYGSEPFRLATLGYDAVLLASRIAADWPVGRRFPARSLTDPTGFVGVDGAFRFARGGVAERALEIREVTPTGTQIVSPAPRGFQ